MLLFPVLVRRRRPAREVGAATVQRRDRVATIFMTALIGLSLKEMLLPIQEVMDAQRFTLVHASALVAFMLTASRFFLGNMHHLQGEDVLRASGRIWFLDFSVIVVEGLLLLLMAGFTLDPARGSLGAPFKTLMVALYFIDISWIALQGALARASTAWARSKIPWQWAVLNSLLIVAFAAPGAAGLEPTPTADAIWLVLLSAGAFIYDVVVVDYSEIFRSGGMIPPSTPA